MTPRRTAVAPYGLALALAAVGGCAARGTAPPAGEPDLVGTVAATAVERPPAAGPVTDVLVTDVVVPASGYDAGVRLHLHDARVVVRRPGGRLERASRAAVVPGAALRAWTTGVELRSLPPQWTATYVEVTPAP